MHDVFIHPTAMIDEGAKIGAKCTIWHFSHIMSGASLGDSCNIGQNVMVAPRVIIGNNVKIQNNVSVYEESYAKTMFFWDHRASSPT